MALLFNIASTIGKTVGNNLNIHFKFNLNTNLANWGVGVESCGKGMSLNNVGMPGLLLKWRGRNKMIDLKLADNFQFGYF